MRTVLFNGPFIPEIDTGYNVQANGVSINFLKDPFCFRYNIITNGDDKNIKPNKPVNFIDEDMKILKPLTATKIVEVPQYIYKEHIINKNNVIYKNIYVPYTGPVYKIKKVKIPVYKERIKYVPKIIEKEKIYEIPKIEIKNKIQEKLVYLHKNNIKYKKLNHVVERIIPTLKNEIVEKTVELSNIQIPNFPEYNENSEIFASNDLGIIEVYKKDEEEKNQEKKVAERIVQEEIFEKNEEIEEIGEISKIKKVKEKEEIEKLQEKEEIKENEKNEGIKEIEGNGFNMIKGSLPSLKLCLFHEIKKKQREDIDMSPQKPYLKFSEELNLSNVSSENTEESFNMYSSEKTNSNDDSSKTP